MKLLVGLGNSGGRYRETRHNIGWELVEAIAASLNVALKSKSELHGEIAEAHYGSDKLILLKPTTMMNESGTAVRAAAEYYKLSPEDVIVIYDDVDVPFGTVRFRRSNSATGHRGIQSVLEAMKNQTICQVRIGISDNRAVALPSEAYVLQPFNPEEMSVLESILAPMTVNILDHLDNFTDETVRYE